MSTEARYLTIEKFNELMKELELLKSDRRKEVAEHLEYAKKLGDLSENAEYHQAREEQAEVEDRIHHLDNLLKNAVIPITSGSDTVTVGSTVRLERQDIPSDKTTLLYTIVGSEEVDMARGKISNVSPLGSALMGHKQDDVVKVQTPKGVAVYKVAVVK